MWKVNIYIETSTTYKAQKERWYGFILECRRKDGNLKTKECFFQGELTYNQAALDAVLKAFKEINMSCEVSIHTENGYVANRLTKLPELMAAGFKDTRGKDIKNQEQWMEICNEKKEHIITTDTEKHSYSNWMKRRMEELKGEEKESYESSRNLEKYCDERKCETCIFNQSKCVLRGWPAPALWPLGWLKKKGEKDGIHTVNHG